MHNAYGYYIVDVDGVTLASFGEGVTQWSMCNLEGETVPRYVSIWDDGKLCDSCGIEHELAALTVIADDGADNGTHWSICPMCMACPIQ